MRGLAVLIMIEAPPISHWLIEIVQAEHPLNEEIVLDRTTPLPAAWRGVAQACGIHLEPHQYIILMVTATLGAIGGAGIPGGSIVMMGMVFNSIGLLLGGIALILGIDRILDMLRTVLNLTCDCLMTVIIDKSEGTFNDMVYNDPNL